MLARACAEGNDHAWEVFLTRYREKLYGFAWQIAKEDSAAGSAEHYDPGSTGGASMAWTWMSPKAVSWVTDTFWILAS